MSLNLSGSPLVLLRPAATPSRSESSQFPHLDSKSFCDPAKPHADFPLLGGKGAQIRHLVLILAMIWRQHMRDDERDDKHVEKVIDHLVSFLSVPSNHR